MKSETIKRIEDQCEWDGDCLLWQGGVNSKGHPLMSFQGKTGSLVRRVLQEVRTGRSLPKAVVMRAVCGNKLCMARDHCKEWTRAQVMAQLGERGELSRPDKKRSNQRSAPKKLTPEQVAEIRSSNETGVELAKQYGVSHTNISRIRRGESWANYGASVFNWRPAA